MNAWGTLTPMPPLPNKIKTVLDTADRAMSLVERVVARLSGDPKRRAQVLRSLAVRQRARARRALTQWGMDRHFAKARSLDERADILDPLAPTVCVDA